MLGQLLDGRYKILEKLGEGAFGETYLAQDQKRPGSPHCVVKRLKPGYTDHRVLELFEKEAEVLERLGRHPQIPQLLAHFADEQELFIVQDYIEGHSLRKEIRPGRRLNEDYVVRMLHDILQVLVFVHQNNVVHRDIKPENIMRQLNGTLMLIDFGAVKELGTMSVNPMGQIATSVVIGTLGYMPTEQAKGKPRLCSDVYSVGMIGIEALTGVYPLSLPEDPQTGEVIWRDRAEVSDRLADILDQMVRDRHTLRYSSANEALLALQAMIDIPPNPLPAAPPAKPSIAQYLGSTINALTLKVDVLTVNMQGQETLRRANEIELVSEDLGDGTILELIAIMGGTFRMGSPEDEIPDEAETPQHSVAVHPFFMSMFPVTQAQWRSIAALPVVNRELDPAPSRFRGKDRPVEMVSWYDAIEFCARLSQRHGRTYRLPSEAEWEYACRAGTTTPFHYGETLTPDLSNYNGNHTFGSGPKGVYREETTPVGIFPANAFGLHDMHGNVWEWCADHWHDTYENAPRNSQAWLIEDESESNTHFPRVLRGGAWNRDPWTCRSAYRDRDQPTTRNKFIGFRIVCDLPKIG
ncbi:protein kinase [filamentous cyanobacterium CCP1]|nr:protein kinase [filamentous cyanobacterium CCP2]PSB67645.1 protein kinase [filamentous cyanobacterium CCP1]